MDTSEHNLINLFKQLGLPDDEEGRQAFLQKHGPLPADVALPDAAFWSSAQARFLRESIRQDSDWAEIVDRLDAMFRG